MNKGFAEGFDEAMADYAANRMNIAIHGDDAVLLLHLRRKAERVPDFDYTSRMVSAIHIAPPSSAFAAAPSSTSTG